MVAVHKNVVCAPKAPSLGIIHINTSYIVIMCQSDGRYVMWDTNFHVNYLFKIGSYNNSVPRAQVGTYHK